MSVAVCGLLMPATVVVIFLLLSVLVVAEGGGSSITAASDHVEDIGFSPVVDESIPFFMLGDFGGAPGSMHNGAFKLILYVLSPLCFLYYLL